MSLLQCSMVLAAWRNAENSLQSVNLTMPTEGQINKLKARNPSVVGCGGADAAAVRRQALTSRCCVSLHPLAAERIRLHRFRISQKKQPIARGRHPQIRPHVEYALLRTSNRLTESYLCRQPETVLFSEFRFFSRGAQCTHRSAPETEVRRRFKNTMATPSSLLN